MTLLDENILAFGQLSDFLKATVNQNKEHIAKGLEEDYEKLNKIIAKLKISNPWFIEDFVRYQLNALADITTFEKLNKWLKPYQTKIKNATPKNIGVVMAGNIAFVGFHDFLSVLITNNRLLLKISSKDDILPRFIINVLIKIAPHFEKMIEFQDKLKTFDAIIATGSDNTSRYFEYYFGKVPNIIRKNRNSIAILDGKETEEDLSNLADDIFLHFGLGCRNVSKIYIPEDFELQRIFKAVYKYSHLLNHHKYANNYEYNRAVYLLSKDNFLENGFFIIREDTEIATPIAVLNYERYSKTELLQKIYEANKDKIQIVVSNIDLGNIPTVKFGKSQIPELDDYEDRVNTLEFLTKLK